jgi:nitroreductase
MIDLLRTRRSIRKYEKKKIDDKSIEILKEAVLRSPCARGISTWTFVFVENQDLISRLSVSRDQGSGFLKDSALAVVICGDESANDMWTENCCIAATILQLTAHSLGLGTCWCQIRNRQHTKEKTSESYLQDLLNIPVNLRVECVIGIGHAAESKEPRPKENLEYGRIKYNSYK